jgi:hypothetical protein
LLKLPEAPFGAWCCAGPIPPAAISPQCLYLSSPSLSSSGASSSKASPKPPQSTSGPSSPRVQQQVTAEQLQSPSPRASRPIPRRGLRSKTPRGSGARKLRALSSRCRDRPSESARRAGGQMERAPSNASGISKPTRVPTGGKKRGRLGPGRGRLVRPRPAGRDPEARRGRRTGRGVDWRRGGERGLTRRRRRRLGVGGAGASGLKKITRPSTAVLPQRARELLLQSSPCPRARAAQALMIFWEAGRRVLLGGGNGRRMELFEFNFGN